MTSKPATITQKQAKTLLPPRAADSHKGQFGSVLIIGGSDGMTGAAILAGRAALKLGAGAVHVAMLSSKAPSVDPAQPELMLHDASTSLPTIPHTVLAAGCGLGRTMHAQTILHHILGLDLPLILDADALNILAMRPDFRSMVISRKNETVITPHPGEAARLLGTSTDEVQADRPAVTHELSNKFKCNVVLKGANTLCLSHKGKLWVNESGNSGMSAPGMGDVLTGMISAFVAQGATAESAMMLAVHLHGAAGDALAKQQASIGMTATEVLEWSRWLLNRWVN